MSQFFMIKETKMKGRAETLQRTLIDDGRTYTSKDDVIREAKMNLNLPNEIIYVVEVAGKIIGEMQIKEEDLKEN